MNIPRFAALLASAAISLALSSAAFAADSIKIGLILPMTGPSASTGRQIDAASRAGSECGAAFLSAGCSTRATGMGSGEGFVSREICRESAFRSAFLLRLFLDTGRDCGQFLRAVICRHVTPAVRPNQILWRAVILGSWQRGDGPRPRYSALGDGDCVSPFLASRPA